MYLSLRLLHRIANYITYRITLYLQIQLFISLISWPFLAAWGLPFAPAGLIGNFIYAPFLIVFLLLSSCICFTELFYLPNGFLIYLLELLTTLWQSILSSGTRSWLFLGAHPPFSITLLLPFIAFCIILYKPLTSSRRIFALSIVYLIAGCIVPHLYTSTDLHLHIPYYTQELTLIRSQNHTTLIDPGIIGRHLSAPKKISYTLLPLLIKQGITKLDSIIIPKPSYMVFEALSRLISSFPVKAIYIPSWQGVCKNRCWAAWEQLLRNAQKYHTKINLVSKPLTLSCGKISYALTPSKKHSKRNNLIYHELICSKN